MGKSKVINPFSLVSELWQNRQLIWKLAANDFKKRYAGSYMGKIWAFVQPVVTVLMYWIVFDKVFQTKAQLVASGVEVPYVLHLTAGLVPWFFFSEALSGGTSALLEYTYLVKKVVFKISILPLIKVIAASFTHIFFAVVLLVIACLYGYFPTLCTVQVVYYTICLFVLVLGICFMTSAVVVFFKDLQQIIGIGLQLGMWATPILWDLNMLSPNMQKIISINPLVYVVQGYRNAVYGNGWFWQDIPGTIYFWVVTALLFVLGAFVFKRLKVHFADVL